MSPKRSWRGSPVWGTPWTGTNGTTADEVLASQDYDLVILDVVLAALDGFAVLKRLRQRACPTPVLVLTARSAVDDCVDALASWTRGPTIPPTAFFLLAIRFAEPARRVITDEADANLTAVARPLHNFTCARRAGNDARAYPCKGKCPCMFGGEHHERPTRSIR